MIDENLESGDEVKLVSDNSPTLTGDVAIFQDQSEPSQTPPEMQKRMMNKYLQFFLGVLVYPYFVVYCRLFLF